MKKNTKPDNADHNTQEIKQEWVQLTQWGDRVPSFGTMRNLVARRKENGAEVFLALVNNRFYVNIAKFNEWMFNQKS